jgi:hypothetical protein
MDRYNYLNIIDRGGHTPFFMSKNNFNKDEFRVRVLKLKNELYHDSNWYSNPKNLADKYLNKVLEIIDEYRY